MMHLGGTLVVNTSQKNSFLFEVLNSERIPLGTLSYFRERFRDRLYDLVVEEFVKQNAENNLTRAEVARRIGRRPEQITRWFGAPGNWTLETVSDLLLAIAKSEPDVRLLPLEGRHVRNYRSPSLSASQQTRAVSRRPARSAMDANDPQKDGARFRTEQVGLVRQTDPSSKILDRGDRYEAARN